MTGDLNLGQSPDVVIVGGGVAGCAMAIALRRFVPALHVCLVDRGRAPGGRDTDVNADAHKIRPRIGETLPPEIIIPMQQLGIWESFTAMLPLASAGTLAAWGANQPHANEYVFSPYGQGWHLDRQRFDAIMRALALQQGIRCISQSQVMDVERKSDQWHLQLQTAKEEGVASRQTLTTRFVVDASGRSARLSRRIGSNLQAFDKLVGIYRFYSPSVDDQPGSAHSESGTAIESFTNGWWYTARLPGRTRVTAVMTDADLARSKNYRDGFQYDKAISETRLIADRIAGLTAISVPRVTAAHTQCLDQIAGRAWLATGDAAFTYDPLSSLGIFKALRMSIYASYAIKDFFNTKDQELLKYNQVAAAEFTSYMDKRRECYAEEARFAHNMFWQRRLAA